MKRSFTLELPVIEPAAQFGPPLPVLARCPSAAAGSMPHSRSEAKALIASTGGRRSMWKADLCAYCPGMVHLTRREPERRRTWVSAVTEGLCLTALAAFIFTFGLWALLFLLGVLR